jgi:hypothetical protein
MSIIQDALKKVQGIPEGKRTDGFGTGGYKTTGCNYREKRSPRSLPFLVVIFLALASFYFFRNVFPGVKSAAIGPETAVSAAAPAAAASAEEVTPVSLRAQAGEAAAGVPDPTFVLSGIMMLEGGPRAIINGFVVEKGDVIGGANVERVDNDRVLLRSGDDKITLKLK